MHPKNVISHFQPRGWFVFDHSSMTIYDYPWLSMLSRWLMSSGLEVLEVQHFHHWRTIGFFILQHSFTFGEVAPKKLTDATKENGKKAKGEMKEGGDKSGTTSTFKKESECSMGWTWSALEPPVCHRKYSNMFFQSSYQDRRHSSKEQWTKTRSTKRNTQRPNDFMMTHP